MNWIDVVVTLTVVAATLSSLRAGFLRQAFAIIGSVVGVYGALAHRATLAAVLAPAIDNPALAGMVAFLLIFIGVWIASALLASAAYAALQACGLAWADHLLGMLVGLAIGLGAAMGLLLLLARLPFGSLRQALGDSLLASAVFKALPHLRELLPGDLRLLRSV